MAHSPSELLWNAPAVAPGIVRGLRRFEYERLVASGAFADEHVELLEGQICFMSPHGPLHDGTMDILFDVLRPLLDRVRIRVQSAFAASDGSQPEPDVAVVPRRDYRERHPDEAYLIIEVADSSLERDRSLKAEIYSGSRVSEYWVVNLQDSTLVVFRNPGPGGYADVSVLAPGDRVRPEAFPDLELLVGDLFRAEG